MHRHAPPSLPAPRPPSSARSSLHHSLPSLQPCPSQGPGRAGIGGTPKLGAGRGSPYLKLVRVQRADAGLGSEWTLSTSCAWQGEEEACRAWAQVEVRLGGGVEVPPLACLGSEHRPPEGGHPVSAPFFLPSETRNLALAACPQPPACLPAYALHACPPIRPSVCLLLNVPAGQGRALGPREVWRAQSLAELGAGSSLPARGQLLTSGYCSILGFLVGPGLCTTISRIGVSQPTWPQAGRGEAGCAWVREEPRLPLAAAVRLRGPLPSRPCLHRLFVLSLLPLLPALLLLLFLSVLCTQAAH